MWYGYLKDEVAKRTEISELDSILGKKDEDDIDKESLGKYQDLFITILCIFIYLLLEWQAILTGIESAIILFGYL